jgi:hypothetical protein
MHYLLWPFFRVVNLESVYVLYCTSWYVYIYEIVTPILGCRAVSQTLCFTWYQIRLRWLPLPLPPLPLLRRPLLLLRPSSPRSPWRGCKPDPLGSLLWVLSRRCPRLDWLLHHPPPALVWRAICPRRSLLAALLPRPAWPRCRSMVVSRPCPMGPTLHRSMAPTRAHVRRTGADLRCPTDATVYLAGDACGTVNVHRPVGNPKRKVWWI